MLLLLWSRSLLLMLLTELLLLLGWWRNFRLLFPRSSSTEMHPDVAQEVGCVGEIVAAQVTARVLKVKQMIRML